MIKQVIVMRKDLNMRKGKMCAQAAHASLKVFFDRMEKFQLAGVTVPMYVCDFTREMEIWQEGTFTKICVGVDSEHELFDIYGLAKQAGIPCALIEDSGKTEFDKPTNTCCAIGPDYNEKIDKITRKLKLL